MCLDPEYSASVPEQTARIARAAFRKGNVYMTMRDEFGPFFEDPQFADLFPPQGQPAEAPWRLALVTVMQFAEGLSDRQAADAVRARIDWKYALSLDLTDDGFDFSVLSQFRTQLLAGGAEHRLLETMLTVYKEKGLLKTRGKQRTDSTHILAAIRILNRLSCVGEAMRAVLNTLAEGAALDLPRFRVGSVKQVPCSAVSSALFRISLSKSARPLYIAVALEPRFCRCIFCASFPEEG